MTKIPAQCQSCGHEFLDESFHFAGADGLTMEGNFVGCPRCGGLARLGEGTFNVRDAVLEFVDGPEWTREALQRLADATEMAQPLADTDPDAAVEAVAAAEPSLREKLRAAARSNELSNFLTALGLAIAILMR